MRERGEMVESGVIEGFLEGLKVKGRNTVTINEYGSNLREYAQYLAECGCSLYSATRETIEAYYLAVHARPLNPRAVCKKQHAVYALYEWMHQCGNLLLNPAPRPTFTKHASLPPSLPDWHSLLPLYRALYRSSRPVDQRDFSLIDLAYSCGLRRAELHRLDIVDVNADEKTLRISGKGGRERMVPIGEKTLGDLLHYLYRVRPKIVTSGVTPAVFVSWKGGGRRMNLYSINAVFRRLRKRLCLDRRFSPHKLRHAFATELIRHGAAVQDVSRMLGHVKLETTQIYTRVMPLGLKKHHATHHPRG